MAELKRRGVSTMHHHVMRESFSVETKLEMATDVGEPAPEGAEGRVLAGGGSPRAGGAGAARRV